MTKKPGTHTNTIMALRSRALGRYVVARAWKQIDADEYRVHHVTLVDKPVMVCRSAKTARLLVGMMPRRVMEMIAEARDSMDRAQTNLDNGIRAGWCAADLDHARRWIETLEARLVELDALLASPVDVVEVVITTTVVERVLP